MFIDFFDFLVLLQKKRKEKIKERDRKSKRREEQRWEKSY
jgi:hypothetical protein